MSTGPQGADAAPLLQLIGLGVGFGAVRVIDGLDLSVRPGEVLGVLGPNGAGKSTLFNLITGTLRADAGRVVHAGVDISGWSAFRRCRRGIGRTYQIPKPFRHMTVFESVLVAATHSKQVDIATARPVAIEVLERSGLAARSRQFAGTLSLLDLKRLELARAMAVQPQLMLLDEIAGGLTEGECATLLDILRAEQARGVTIVWIEHVLHALQQVATRLAVLFGGSILVDGDPAAVLADPRVREAYLGS